MLYYVHEVKILLYPLNWYTCHFYPSHILLYMSLLLDPVLHPMVLKYVLRSYIYFFLHNHHQYQTKISFMPNAFKTTYIMHHIMLHMNLLAPFTQWSLLTQMPHPLIGQDQKWTSHQSTATVSGHHDKMRLPTWVLAGLCCNGYNRLLVKRNIKEDVQRRGETQRREIIQSCDYKVKLSDTNTILK